MERRYRTRGAIRRTMSRLAETGKAMSKLPSNIIIDILSRPPLMSTVRFMCVSKTWKNMLTSPHFVNLYLARTPATSLLLLNPFNGILERDCHKPNVHLLDIISALGRYSFV